MYQDEVDVIELGKAVERLMLNVDFQKVILEEFIDKQGLDIAKSFNGSEEQVDTLKSITLLSNYLHTKIDDGKIVVQTNNKG